MDITLEKKEYKEILNSLKLLKIYQMLFKIKRTKRKKLI